MYKLIKAIEIWDGTRNNIKNRTVY
jgi:hypothetical protein